MSVDLVTNSKKPWTRPPPTKNISPLDPGIDSNPKLKQNKSLTLDFKYTDKKKIKNNAIHTKNKTKESWRKGKIQKIIAQMISNLLG